MSGLEIITPCGCYITVNHQQGDRGVTCDHMNVWIVRATPVITVSYTIANHHVNVRDDE